MSSQQDDNRNMQRREFLSGALQTAGATGLLTTPAGRAVGANDPRNRGAHRLWGRGRYVAGLMRETRGSSLPQRPTSICRMRSAAASGPDRSRGLPGFPAASRA